jgi:hypothetical protein
VLLESVHSVGMSSSPCLGRIPTGISNIRVSNMPDRNPPCAVVAYIVGRVNGGEGAFEAAHLLAANVGLAEVSPKQVVVSILNSRCPVVF